MQDAHDQRRQGLLFAVGAYLSWGVLPIYWKLLHHVPATQILAHRMVWSLAVVVGLIALRLGAGARSPASCAAVARSWPSPPPRSCSPSTGTSTSGR